jgi:hypothetical protein
VLHQFTKCLSSAETNAYVVATEIVERTLISLVPSVLLLDRDDAYLCCCLLGNDGLGFDDGSVTPDQS